MSRPDRAVEVFLDGHACSQAILVAYGPDYGLAEEQAARVGAGFGGGMRLGSVCGAVSGAVMVLGLALCGDECITGKGREAINASVVTFGERFVDCEGSLDCADILGCDLRTAEGAAMAKQDRLFETVCPRAVRTAADILEEMLPPS